MRPWIILLVAVLTAAGCGASEATSSPASDAPAPTAGGDVLEERGAGLTLTPDTSGAADLEGGRYRLGWVAEGCTSFDVEWAPTDGDPIAIDVAPGSGETFVELPAGAGFLNRVADCDYTLRFESAS